MHMKKNTNVQKKTWEKTNKKNRMQKTKNITKKQIIKDLETIKYTNPLLENTKNKNLTEENFSNYQENIKNILIQLLGNISFIKIVFTPEEIIKKDRIQNNLSEAKKQCKFLEEYCIFLNKPNIPLPYTYLWSITHKLKPTAENIETSIYNETIHSKRKNERFNFGKKIIDLTIDNIQQQIKKIEKIENNLYTQKKFSPYITGEEKMNIYKNKWTLKNIQIENKLPKNLFIESYQEIFEIIIDDLLSNAIKFTPEWGKITIGITKEDEKKITFFVKDTGIGIPKWIDVFSHTYTTPSIDGNQWTWLWLANAKLFTEIMRENIEHTENTPQGTIFTFSMKKNPQQKDLQK